MPLKGLIFGGLSAVLVLVLSVLLLSALGVGVVGGAPGSLALLALLALVEELGRGIMLYKLFEKASWHLSSVSTFALGFFGVEALLKYEQLGGSSISLTGFKSPQLLIILALSLLAHVFFTLLWYWVSRGKMTFNMRYFALTVAAVSLVHFIWNTAILKLGL